MNNEHFLFIDTAGFGAADIAIQDNFSDIEACLTALGPFTTLVGVIFVYGCPDRLFEHDLKVIQWLQCFCGPEFFGNMTVVTTKWDLFCQEGFEDHWLRMKELEGVLSPMLCPKGRFRPAVLYHHGLQGGEGHPDAAVAFSRVLSQKRQSEERASALRAHVEERYCNTSPKPIQFLEELKDGKERHETEAWKALAHDLFASEVQIVGNRAVVVAKPVRARDDEGGQASSATPSEGTANTADGQPEKEAKVSQEAPPPAPKGDTQPQDHESPSPEPKGDAKPQDNESRAKFANDVGAWLRLFYEVLKGFRGARTHRGMVVGLPAAPEPPSTWGAWFCSWFAGPPKTGPN